MNSKSSLAATGFKIPRKHGSEVNVHNTGVWGATSLSDGSQSGDVQYIDCSINDIEFRRDIIDPFLASILQPPLRTMTTVLYGRRILNKRLKDRFLARQNKLKSYGSGEHAEVSFAYMLLENDQSNEEEHFLCRNGIYCGYSGITGELGLCSQGVYLSLHPDTCSPTELFRDQKMRILMFKVLKGRPKHISPDSATSDLRPDKAATSHVYKLSSDLTYEPSSVARFKLSQIFLYEYDDAGNIIEIPSSILPYAALTVQFEMPRKGHSTILLRSLNPINDRNSIIWSGRLVFGNTAIESADMVAPASNATVKPTGFCSSLDVKVFVSSTDWILFPPIILLLAKPGMLLQRPTKCHLNINNKILLAEYRIIVSNCDSSTISPTFRRVHNNVRKSQLIGVSVLPSGTTVFCIPNSEVSSLLGFPRYEHPVFHCIFISPEEEKKDSFYQHNVPFMDELSLKPTADERINAGTNEIRNKISQFHSQKNVIYASAQAPVPLRTVLSPMTQPPMRQNWPEPRQSGPHVPCFPHPIPPLNVMGPMPPRPMPIRHMPTEQMPAGPMPHVSMPHPSQMYSLPQMFVPPPPPPPSGSPHQCTPEPPPPPPPPPITDEMEQSDNISKAYAFSNLKEPTSSTTDSSDIELKRKKFRDAMEGRQTTPEKASASVNSSSDMEISPSHVHTTFTPDVLQMLGSVRDPRMKRKLESDPRFLQEFMRDKKRQNIQPNQNEPKGSNLNRKRTAEAELDEPYSPTQSFDVCGKYINSNSGANRNLNEPMEIDDDDFASNSNAKLNSNFKRRTSANETPAQIGSKALINDDKTALPTQTSIQRKHDFNLKAAGKLDDSPSVQIISPEDKPSAVKQLINEPTVITLDETEGLEEGEISAEVSSIVFNPILTSTPCVKSDIMSLPENKSSKQELAPPPNTQASSASKGFNFNFLNWTGGSKNTNDATRGEATTYYTVTQFDDTLEPSKVNKEQPRNVSFNEEGDDFTLTIVETDEEIKSNPLDATSLNELLSPKDEAREESISDINTTVIPLEQTGITQRPTSLSQAIEDDKNDFEDTDYRDQNTIIKRFTSYPSKSHDANNVMTLGMNLQSHAIGSQSESCGSVQKSTSNNISLQLPEFAQICGDKVLSARIVEDVGSEENNAKGHSQGSLTYQHPEVCSSSNSAVQTVGRLTGIGIPKLASCSNRNLGTNAQNPTYSPNNVLDQQPLHNGNNTQSPATSQPIPFRLHRLDIPPPQVNVPPPYIPPPSLVGNSSQQLDSSAATNQEAVQGFDPRLFRRNPDFANNLQLSASQPIFMNGVASRSVYPDTNIVNRNSSHSPDNQHF